MSTLRETINAAITAAEADKASAITAADTKLATLRAQLSQEEGAFVALLDVESHKVVAFFESVWAHIHPAAPDASTETPAA